MNIMQSISEIPSKIVFVVNLLIDMISEVCSSLKDFYEMLRDFNNTIVSVTADPSANTGLPVVQAIGTFRYLVGEVAFHVIYICILFGCLFTIYKLVCLLLEAWNVLKARVKGGAYSGTALATVISKFIK